MRRPHASGIGGLVARLMLTGLGLGGLVGMPTAYSMLAARAPTATHAVPNEVEDMPIVEGDTAEGGNGHVVGRAPDGFFYVEIGSGTGHLRCLVDTGASMLTLSSAAAPQLGIDPAGLRYDGRLIGAAGSKAAAIGRFSRLDIAGNPVRGVKATIVRGGGAACLIGQRLLRRLGPIHLDGDELRFG